MEATCYYYSTNIKFVAKHEDYVVKGLLIFGTNYGAKFER